jgi:hypothetical protein
MTAAFAFPGGKEAVKISLKIRSVGQEEDRGKGGPAENIVIVGFKIGKDIGPGTVVQGLRPVKDAAAEKVKIPLVDEQCLSVADEPALPLYGEDHGIMSAGMPGNDRLSRINVVLSDGDNFG